MNFKKEEKKLLIIAIFGISVGILSILIETIVFITSIIKLAGG